MDFDNDYWSANDKIFDEKTTLDLRNVGISHGIGDVGEGLKANVFLGASSVELGFFGVQKGSRSSPTGHTPESYSKDEREQMREMAKINEIELSTHAAPDLGWMSGFNRRDGFSEEIAEQSLHEVKRAIEFAADVAEGGPVVFHLGEFPRPVVYAEERKGMPSYLKSEAGFEAYPHEAEKAVTYLVDEKTGRIIQSVKEDEIIYRPIAKPLAEGEKYSDPNTKRPLKYKPLLTQNREPLTDPVTGDVVYDYELDEKMNIRIEPLTYTQYKEEKLKDGFEEKEIPKEFFKEQSKVEIQRTLGNADEYEVHYKQSRELRDKIEKAIDFYKKIQEKVPKENWDYYKQQIHKELPFLPPEEKDPIEFLQEKLRETDKRIAYSREIAISSRQQAQEIKDKMDRAKPIDEYAVEKSSVNIARAAMYAYKVEKDKGLEKPLWVAPENWSPESYGSSPQELKEIVLKSREQMVDMLKKKQMSESEARSVAEDHIKATFDVGHMNFWKKYYQGTDEDFNKWYITNVKDLIKEGIIGHVHLHDNFGYHDEHLRPGEGEAPIKEFLKELEKEGFKGKIIAEPGGQKQGQYHTVWTSAIGLSASPIYKIGSASRTWTDIQGSYFGRTGSPGYVVGEYAPSRDWTLWSEVPLE